MFKRDSEGAEPDPARQRKILIGALAGAALLAVLGVLVIVPALFGGGSGGNTVIPVTQHRASPKPSVTATPSAAATIAPTVAKGLRDPFAKLPQEIVAVAATAPATSGTSATSATSTTATTTGSGSTATGTTSTAGSSTDNTCSDIKPQTTEVRLALADWTANRSTQKQVADRLADPVKALETLDANATTSSLKSALDKYSKTLAKVAGEFSQGNGPPAGDADLKYLSAGIAACK